MKKRIIQGMLVACMLLIGFVAMAQTSSNPVGKWDTTFPEAPAEYSKGQAEFKMQDGKLMYIAYMDGQPIGQPVEAVKKDNGYVCKMESEFGTITITFTPDGNNLKGTLGSDQFSMNFTMTPAKK